jgi:uncharacterized protein with ATP-grasp and redox domains
VARGFRGQDETKDACAGEQNALIDSLEDEPVAWVLKARADIIARSMAVLQSALIVSTVGN